MQIYLIVAVSMIVWKSAYKIVHLFRLAIFIDPLNVMDFKKEPLFSLAGYFLFSIEDFMSRNGSMFCHLL